MIRTYINKKYCVSTIQRESSSIEAPVQYYETIVMELDGEKDILHQEDSSGIKDIAIQRHLDLCLIWSKKE